MARFTLDEVIKATGGTLLQKGAADDFTDVATDTRKITQGSIFVALKGERFDGNDFAASAAEKGAGCVVVSRPVEAEGAAIVEVSDTLLAYQKLAEYHRRRFLIPVVAITGSNGKTTTKDLTAAVLGAKFNTLKTEANFNNEVGLPLTLLKLTKKHQAAVVEMGMRGLGQIAAMAAFAHPTVAIVTNVGETHMELLGSMENIAKAKAELALAAGVNIVILNGDDVYVKKMREMARGKVLLFGCDLANDVRAENIACTSNKTEFDCIIDDKRAHMEISLSGRHNVYNALAAIAAGHALGLSLAEIKQGLKNAATTAMRLTVSHYKDYVIVNDAYNASPASMKAALEALDDISAGGRKIAVLGDMLELGEISVKAHEDVGILAGAHRLSYVITLGEMAEHIAKKAKENGISAFSAKSHEAAAEKLKEILRDGDTVLFKGSRGMKMEKVIELI